MDSGYIMLPISITVFLLILLVLASLEDLRIREVPDVLSYFVMAAGLTHAAYISLQTTNMLPLLYSIGGLVSAYLFGLALMYMHMWGGGDTKLLMGVATFLTRWPPTTIITYVFLLFFLGSLYGMVWTVYLIVKNWRELVQTHPALTYIPLMSGGAILLSLIPIYVFIPSSYQLILSIGISVLFISLAATYILQRAEQILTVEDVTKQDVVLGDWLVESVPVTDGHVHPRNTGVSEEDLERIKNSSLDTLRVKYGIPFVPSFLFAFITLLYIEYYDIGLLSTIVSLIV